MSWEDQGRQQHGWFGDGKASQTSAGGSGDGNAFDPGTLAQRIQAVAHGVIGALPSALSRRAEVQHHDGGLSQLTEVMAAWSQNDKGDPRRFADRFFGPSSGDQAVLKLFAAAPGARFAASHADLREASERVSDAMQLVGLDRWPRFLADLHERVGDPVVAAAAPAALAVAASGRPEVGSGPSGQLPAPQKSQTEQNATDLAKLMVTEAGGTTAVAMTAVGWTVRNRMERNGHSDVSDVWFAYRHGKNPTQDAIRIASGILDCSIPDPTHGATHFYTPDAMPKNGDKTQGKDIGGGLEFVRGVQRDKKPIENWKPGFSTTMERRLVPDVEEKVFKFYRQNGNGYVR